MDRDRSGVVEESSRAKGMEVAMRGRLRPTITFPGFYLSVGRSLYIDRLRRFLLWVPTKWRFASNKYEGA